ncbi:uncharacterized protein BCR38DRAFT_427874 [Pseudomassariella vexata]|uniref:Transcription factor domain-containing protein n=1 Tax=Pseudomassariella vexata TaxID=1141098 RepID=A0A1Y2E8M9_9PEZI|nr:uncharacterized protein BCR38DRAFT_427874 [Pseudomassariella vexata]ORY67674.1 hypothetical protein BCR38DRAFT_427874 [Pseudomassariella vexata]
MPASKEPGDNFDELRDQHVGFINDLLPSSDEEDDSSASASAPSVASTFNFADMSTPSSASSASRRPLSNLAMKPQFNLDSAKKLLDTFKEMLPHYPCVVLPEDASVRSMAKDMPFVLLAILAATSCSSSLQGHSLYDEEFRKVLGLKFVTGGERSLELLQGILIYSAWYPFHLRPKNRQASQYLRMATDIVHDLDLGQEKTILARVETGLHAEDIDKIRGFIACFYLVSIYSGTWRKRSTLPYTHWVDTCCDLLETQSHREHDHLLAWLIRLQHVVEEVNALRDQYREPNSKSGHQLQLIRIGLETQLREWQTRMPIYLSMMSTLMMTMMFTEMYLIACPIMNPPKTRPAGSGEFPIDPIRLMGTTHTLRAFLGYINGLPPGYTTRFSTADWNHLISCNILAFRLSLPLEICPDFDTALARQILNYNSFLEKFCTESEAETSVAAAPRKTDAGTAFRIVLRALKKKFDKKIAAEDARAAAIKESRFVRGCPMFDGSLDEHLALWDGHGQLESAADGHSYSTAQTSYSGTSSEGRPGPYNTSVDANGKPLVFHDLWATMTMGWADWDTSESDVIGTEVTGIDSSGFL